MLNKNTQNGFQSSQGFGVQNPQVDQWQLAAALASLPDSKLTNDYMNADQPNGQMVSGHYVAPAWTQNLAALTKNAVGGQMYRQRDAKTQQIIDALRQNNPNSRFDNLQDPGGMAMPVGLG